METFGMITCFFVVLNGLFCFVSLGVFFVFSLGDITASAWWFIGYNYHIFVKKLILGFSCFFKPYFTWMKYILKIFLNNYP